MPTSASARGLEALIHDVVTKPFGMADIRKAVNEALAPRGLANIAGLLRPFLDAFSTRTGIHHTGSSPVQAAWKPHTAHSCEMASNLIRVTRPSRLLGIPLPITKLQFRRINNRRSAPASGRDGFRRARSSPRRICSARSTACPCRRRVSLIDDIDADGAGFRVVSNSTSISVSDAAETASRDPTSACRRCAGRDRCGRAGADPHAAVVLEQHAAARFHDRAHHRAVAVKHFCVEDDPERSMMKLPRPLTADGHSSAAGAEEGQQGGKEGSAAKRPRSRNSFQVVGNQASCNPEQKTSRLKIQRIRSPSAGARYARARAAGACSRRSACATPSRMRRARCASISPGTRTV